MHNVMWGMLGLMSRLSPRGMARQTLAIFSTHDPADGLSKLSPDDIQKIARFYQGRSSRKGALNDGTQSVGANLLKTIQQPTLVIHSREDHSVPFAHAEWSLKYIPQAELCEAGFTGHFFWRGRSASTHEVALVPRSGTRTHEVGTRTHEVGNRKK
ncbi:MAG: alpha/beta hydrolase [Anaerolineales bacterium]|jgi:pimeloyl-ACP methyl ester carboxylesterase